MVAVAAGRLLPFQDKIHLNPGEMLLGDPAGLEAEARQIKAAQDPFQGGPVQAGIQHGPQSHVAA